MRDRERVVTKRPAVMRALQDQALQMRGQLRQRGVRGPLRDLDMVVQGQRGAAVAKGVAPMLHNLRAAGLTLDEIRDEMRAAMDAMVTAATGNDTAA